MIECAPLVDLIDLMNAIIAGHAPYSMSSRMPVVYQPQASNGVWMSYVVLPQDTNRITDAGDGCGACRHP